MLIMRFLLWIPFEFRCSNHFHRRFQELGRLVPVKGTLNASPKNFWKTSSSQLCGNVDPSCSNKNTLMRGFGVTGLHRVLISSPKEHLWDKSEQGLSAMAFSSNISVWPLKYVPGRMVKNSHKHTPKPYGKHSTLTLQLHWIGFIVFVKTISTLITIYHIFFFSKPDVVQCALCFPPLFYLLYNCH